MTRLRRLLAPRWRCAPYLGTEQLVPGFRYRRYRRAVAEAQFFNRLEALRGDGAARFCWRVTSERPRAHSRA